MIDDYDYVLRFSIDTSKLSEYSDQFDYGHVKFQGQQKVQDHHTVTIYK